MQCSVHQCQLPHIVEAPLFLLVKRPCRKAQNGVSIGDKHELSHPQASFLTFIHHSSQRAVSLSLLLKYWSPQRVSPTYLTSVVNPGRPNSESMPRVRGGYGTGIIFRLRGFTREFNPFCFNLNAVWVKVKNSGYTKKNNGSRLLGNVEQEPEPNSFLLPPAQREKEKS